MREESWKENPSYGGEEDNMNENTCNLLLMQQFENTHWSYENLRQVDFIFKL